MHAASSCVEDDTHLAADALAVHERLLLLADLQSAYLHALAERGIDGGLAEQLVAEWSRNVYGMTTYGLLDPSPASRMHSLMMPPLGAMPTPPADVLAEDPSQVPPGEPWLQLVEDPSHDGFEHLVDIDDPGAEAA
jgi:hypothetical protein